MNIPESVAGERAEILKAISGPYGPEVRIGNLNYEFMGWRFHLTRFATDSSGENQNAQMLCWKEIINPEAPGLIQAYKNIRISSGPLPPKEEMDKLLSAAAAWLIAHWWDHALKMCPCQNDDAGGKFRHTVTEALLQYDDDRRSRVPSS